MAIHRFSAYRLPMSRKLDGEPCLYFLILPGIDFPEMKIVLKKNPPVLVFRSNGTNDEIGQFEPRRTRNELKAPSTAECRLARMPASLKLPQRQCCARKSRAQCRPLFELGPRW